MGGRSSSRSAASTTSYQSDMAGDVAGDYVGAGAKVDTEAVAGDKSSGTMSGNKGELFSGGSNNANRGNIVQGSGNTVTETDHGAIADAFDFGKMAMTSVSSQAGTNANYMRDMAKQVGELAHSFQSDGESDKQKIYLYVAGAGFVALVAVAFIMRGGK